MRKTSSSSGARSCGAAVAALLVVLLLYLGPFGILVLDELVFGSWLFERTPDWLHDLLRTIYWPIFKLLEYLYGI